MTTFVNHCGSELFEYNTPVHLKSNQEIFSENHKLVYYLLTYPGIGYKDVRIEH